VATKDIRTAHVHVACDVCGRTLLRGEHADTYLAGGSRRQVCELCTPRAVHEGWVREGAALERGTRSVAGARRRSLLVRLRRPRDEAPLAVPAPPASRSGGNGWRAPREEAAAERADRTREAPARAGRHVRAVPSSAEQRTVAAIERFNASEHPRTIAGVARSLGAPVVVARPLPEHEGLVSIVVSWELCWYRYEIDLSDDAAVRGTGQGYELDELAVEDRVASNAAVDEYGTLTPA
jgi:hypothetical protein